MATVTVRHPANPVVRVVVLCIGLALASAAVVVPTRTGMPTAVVRQTSAQPRTEGAFIENQGQWDASAKFLAETKAGRIWLTDQGVVYDFSQSYRSQRGRRIRGHVVRMEFIGANQAPPRGTAQLPGKYNFLIGNDRSEWATGVRRFAEANSEQLYPGVGLRWYFDKGVPRYDLEVVPGANPSKIAMRFEGASAIIASQGGLTIKTSIGDARHAGLFAYQRIDGGIRQVQCQMKVQGNVSRFEVGDYDRSRPLIIDPLVFGTYVGGSGEEEGTSLKLDPEGNLYLAGYSNSADFPATVGAYDTAANGLNDCFITKLDPAGALVFSTYLGGTNEEFDCDIVIGPTHDIHGVTTTYSSNFPTTAGALDTMYNGNGDMAVFTLDSDGDVLKASTFLGGTSGDFGADITYDQAGNLVVLGFTTSSNAPTTVGAWDVSANGLYDVYAARMSPDCASLAFATYIGGNGNDVPSTILDVSGSLAVAGTTESSDWPATKQLGAGASISNQQLFVVKLDPSGAAQDFNTLFGGSNSEYCGGLAIDSSQNFVVAGGTESADFPTTAAAYQKDAMSGRNGYVAKLSSNGRTILAATYLGGSSYDSIYAMKVDPLGQVFVAGQTISDDLPLPATAEQKLPVGLRDNLIAIFASNLATMKYGTLHGGSDGDSPLGIVQDPSGRIGIGGTTYSQDLPVPDGSDNTLGGINDGFVTVFDPSVHSIQGATANVVGGFGLTTTLKLDIPAIVAGETLQVTSNSAKVASTSVKMAGGVVSKSFGLRTETVKVDTPVTVTVTRNGHSKSMNITLRPGGLQSLKVSPSMLTGGDMAVGSLLLSANAPSKGRIVELSSNDATALYMPLQVLIPQGTAAANFPIWAFSVNATRTVNVKAKLGTMAKVVAVTVNP